MTVLLCCLLVGNYVITFYCYHRLKHVKTLIDTRFAMTIALTGTGMVSVITGMLFFFLLQQFYFAIVVSALLGMIVGFTFGSIVNLNAFYIGGITGFIQGTMDLC